MKALVYTGPLTMAYRDAPDPQPAAEEVLLKIDAVGVCGSDLHAFQGHDERRLAPLILGHEASGRIVGGDLDGQAVVMNPLVSCGQCAGCKSGRINLCVNREIVSMAPREGAFAELLAIPTTNIVPVPEGMDMTKAALAEPIATAWHAVKVGMRHADIPISDCKALVFGGGAVGLAAALSLHAQGCRNIFLAETNLSRHDTVRHEAICEVFNPIGSKLVPDNGADLIIDCVGGRVTREAASAAIRPGGTIIHVGLMDSNDGLDIRKLTLQEVAFVGTYTYTMDDFKETVVAMHDGRLGQLNWYEERPLSDGFAAVSDLLAGRIAQSKVILRPDA